MHFPNSIHAEGWNPKQQLSAGNISMTPLHAQGAAPARRQTIPLVLLGVTLSLVAGAAALSTMFSPKTVEQPWQAMDGLAAPGAGAGQIAPAPVNAPAPLPEPSPVVEPTEPAKLAAAPPQLLPEPWPAEPARPAVTPPAERKPQPVTKMLTPAEPVPLLPPVIDPPAVITLPQPTLATSLPPSPASLPASIPASAPPAPQPASVPASSPASDPPKSDPPKPQAPVVEPSKPDAPDASKAPPVQG
jgi:hypothetical protein